MQPNFSSRGRLAAVLGASPLPVSAAASSLAAFTAALALAAAAAVAAAFAFSEPALAVPRTEMTLPEVNVGKLAFLVENEQVRVTIDVSCSGRWQVAEATVRVAQGGEESDDAVIPAECGPIRGRPYDVIVPAIASGFQAGPAEATATVVLEDPDTGEKTTLQDVAPIDIRTKRGRRAPGG